MTINFSNGMKNKTYIDEIFELIESSENELKSMIVGENCAPPFERIAQMKYDLNVALTDLHKIGKGIKSTEFFGAKNKLTSLIEWCDDKRRDVKSRAQRIELAIIAISNERFEGDLWKEVLRRARNI